MTRSIRRVLVSSTVVAACATVTAIAGIALLSQGTAPAEPTALNTTERIERVTKVAGKPVETVKVGGRETKAAADHLVVTLADDEAKTQFGDRLTPTTLPGTYLLEIDGPVEAERAVVAARPGVERATPDYVVTATRTPDDPQYSTYQWNLPRIDAPQAWDRTTGASSLLTANIDTGVNRNHQDLATRIWTNAGETPGNGIDDDDNGYIDDDTGMDFVNATQPGGVFQNDSNGPSDDHGHGTLTASVTGAATDNATGIAGIDWQAEIVAVKVLDSDGYGFFSDVAEGIRYASVVGAKTANLSLGSFGVDSDAMTDAAIEYATGRGTVVVAASGNDGSSSIVDYPAKHPDAIAVGATGSTDARAGYSNGGAELDLVAPGSGIRGAGLSSNSAYINASGTSLSTPHVTGAVSLLKSINPALTTAQARSILRDSADKVSGMNGANRTNLYGHGRLNAKRALDQLKPYSASWAGQSASPTVSSGEDAAVYVDFKNNGSQAWSNTGSNPVRLGTSHPRDRQSPFYNSTWLTPTRVGSFTGRVESDDSVTATDTIEPGETARFGFTMTAPPRTSAANLREYFQPVVEGVTWLEDWGMYLEASVPAETYQYQYVGQTNPTGVMQPNERQEVTIDLKNTGTSVWRNDTLYDFKLGTSHGKDRSSIAYNDTWQTPNRVGAFDGTVEDDTVTETHEVQPGETARFTFDIKAPSGGTNHREYFQPLIERFAWLKDIGIYYPVVVPSQAYDYTYVGQDSLSGALDQGETATLKLRLKNTGFSDWQSSGSTPFRLGTAHPRDRTSGFADGGSASGWIGTNRVKLTRNLTDAAKNVDGETTVVPGETGEFEFEVVGNPSPGTYKEYFRPVVDGVAWMRDIGIYWSVGVSHPIDVGLAQQSTVNFTSNGTVTIRDVLGAVRGTASAGQTVTLRYTGSSYQAVLPSGTITSCCALTAEQGVSNVFTTSNLADGGSNNRFRGSLSVRNGNVGSWVVNTLNLEEYLRGLGEVPDSWPTEAIKTQVVAARTYAARQISAPKTNIFDLYDDTRDQVYRGYNREIIQPNHVSAINATKGKVVKRNGVLIQAFYSSNAAGHTASNEEVWGGTPISYLRGKADSYSLTSDTDHLWPDTTARDTIRTNYGYGCTVTGVSIPAKYTSGRMKTVRLSGSGCATKDYTLAADTHRNRLGLPSSQVTGISKSGTNFVFAGKGFGHGIGMSQWGAYRRAAAGQSYSTILGFYYSGVSIANLY
ncbi:MAG: SpoIID/LytB domain-containing protein [bacterium]|nr:SpoIID/LytB domain-containing protein [bacterium]